MVDVTGLVTFVEAEDSVADPREMSVSARHEGVLDNGGRILLLDDRGWAISGPPDIWAVTFVEDIAETARMVVGPDGPFDGRSQTDMDADHGTSLAATFQQHGIDVDAVELARLPHAVELGEQLLARIGRQPGTGAGP